MTDTPDRQEVWKLRPANMTPMILRLTRKGGNTLMAFTKPDIQKSDGNLTDVVPEGTPFELVGLDVVSVKGTPHGDGEMVVATVKTAEGDKRLSVWGAYLIAQARSAEPSDFPATVTIQRGPVEGFSDRPDTKRFEPVTDGGANA